MNLDRFNTILSCARLKKWLFFKSLVQKQTWGCVEVPRVKHAFCTPWHTCHFLCHSASAIVPYGAPKHPHVHFWTFSPSQTPSAPHPLTFAPHLVPICQRTPHMPTYSPILCSLLVLPCLPYYFISMSLSYPKPLTIPHLDFWQICITQMRIDTNIL